MSHTLPQWGVGHARARVLAPGDQQLGGGGERGGRPCAPTADAKDLRHGSSQSVHVTRVGGAIDSGGEGGK